MRRLTACTLSLLLLFALQPLLAEAVTQDPTDRFKQHVNRMVTEVHKTEDPAEKRTLIEESLSKLKQAAERVQEMRGVDAEGREALADFEAQVSEKLDELEGENGYERVSDANLDRFADYVQQDMEQAQRMVISISATALALIVLLLLLL